MHQKLLLALLSISILSSNAIGQELSSQSRWLNKGKEGIIWYPNENLPHNDHIEMSGQKVSAVLRYGVDEQGRLNLNRSLIWPMLRTVPNNTHASLMQRFGVKVPALLSVNGLTLENEQVKKIQINGFLTINSEYSIGTKNVGAAKGNLAKPVIALSQTIYPSTQYPQLCERYEIENIDTKAITVMIPTFNTTVQTEKEKGVDGRYTMSTALLGSGTYQVEPGEKIVFYVGFSAFKENEQVQLLDFENELRLRNSFVQEVSNSLDFQSPDSALNQLFRFAKIRATESIFSTKGGLMHSPGGESYYAAIWANDQAEYVNPLFPFIGYEIGNQSAINSFRHFARFMNPAFKPLPSSIIAEGIDIWDGVGDRGDAAMVAYGAARFAMTQGDVEVAKELWSLIEWSLAYCHHRLNVEGVVESDTDELEGRFPAGSANLATSSLYYDALVSAGHLGKDLGVESSTLKRYESQAAQLKTAIEAYFGADVSGFRTYRYYKENDKLRSWIAMPLTVGLFDRADETIDALLSPKLFTKNGLLTQEGTDTFWDRSTLYALRGILNAGETNRGIDYLKFYSQERLLGEHVPYPIEAWPEGSQRHLSAESGLYCRIITEGLFGIRPTGLRSFDITPRLPESWDDMQMNNMHGFGGVSTVRVTRQENQLNVKVLRAGQVVLDKNFRENETISVTF